VVAQLEHPEAFGAVQQRHLDAVFVEDRAGLAPSPLGPLNVVAVEQVGIAGDACKQMLGTLLEPAGNGGVHRVVKQGGVGGGRVRVSGIEPVVA